MAGPSGQGTTNDHCGCDGGVGPSTGPARLRSRRSRSPGPQPAGDRSRSSGGASTAWPRVAAPGANHRSRRGRASGARGIDPKSRAPRRCAGAPVGGRAPCTGVAPRPTPRRRQRRARADHARAPGGQCARIRNRRTPASPSGGRGARRARHPDGAGRTAPPVETTRAGACRDRLDRSCRRGERGNPVASCRNLERARPARRGTGNP